MTAEDGLRASSNPNIGKAAHSFRKATGRQAVNLAPSPSRDWRSFVAPMRGVNSVAKFAANRCDLRKAAKPSSFFPSPIEPGLAASALFWGREMNSKAKESKEALARFNE